MIKRIASKTESMFSAQAVLQRMAIVSVFAVLAFFFSTRAYAGVPVNDGDNTSAATVNPAASKAETTTIRLYLPSKAGEGRVVLPSGETGADSNGRYADISAKKISKDTLMLTGRDALFVVDVLFPLSNTVIKPEHMDNRTALARLDSLFTHSTPEELGTIEITGGASPEGPEKNNERLGRERSRALATWVTGHYPEFAGNLSVGYNGEAWGDFRTLVTGDTTLDGVTKDKLLAIIDSKDTEARKEVRLKGLANYRSMANRFWPYLRYSRLSVRYSIKLEKIGDVPVVYLVNSDDTTEIIYRAPSVPNPNDITVLPFNPVESGQPYTPSGYVQPNAGDGQVNTSVCAGTAVCPCAGLSNDKKTVCGHTDICTCCTCHKVEPAQPSSDVEPVEYEYIKTPLFAASTNALLDLAVAPNFALEVPVGRNFSAYAEYTFPWWLAPSNVWAYEMLKLDLGGRWWLSSVHDATDPANVFRGHFVGINLGAGYYDFEPQHKGYQGEFQNVSLEYGYAWRLSDRWRLDAFIDAGWIGTKYRYYEANSTDEHLLYQYKGKLNWFGPTKAGVSFKYIFTKRTKRIVK